MAKKSVQIDLMKSVIDMFQTSFNRKINDNVPIKNVSATAITKYFSASLVLFTLNFCLFIFKNNSTPLIL